MIPVTEVQATQALVAKTAPVVVIQITTMKSPMTDNADRETEKLLRKAAMLRKAVKMTCSDTNPQMKTMKRSTQNAPIKER